MNSNYGGAAISDQVVMDLMITELEPLLYKYKVNVGCYGHYHVVQRHLAVLNRTVEVKGADEGIVHLPRTTIQGVYNYRDQP